MRQRRVPLELSLYELAGDDQALDVAGALVNLANPDIAIDPLDREIGEIAIAAMDLDRIGAHPLGDLGGEQFRHRRLPQAWLAVIAKLGGVEDEAARGGKLRRHVGETKRDRLVRDDLLSEGLALLRVAKRRLVRGPRHAKRLRGDADASALQIAERDAIPLAFLP